MIRFLEKRERKKGSKGIPFFFLLLLRKGRNAPSSINYEGNADLNARVSRFTARRIDAKDARRSDCISIRRIIIFRACRKSRIHEGLRSPFRRAISYRGDQYATCLSKSKSCVRQEPPISEESSLAEGPTSDKLLIIKKIDGARARARLRVRAIRRVRAPSLRRRKRKVARSVQKGRTDGR